MVLFGYKCITYHSSQNSTGKVVFLRRCSMEPPPPPPLGHQRVGNTWSLNLVTSVGTTVIMVMFGPLKDENLTNGLISSYCSAQKHLPKKSRWTLGQIQYKLQFPTQFPTQLSQLFSVSVAVVNIGSLK